MLVLVFAVLAIGLPLLLCGAEWLVAWVRRAWMDD